MYRKWKFFACADIEERKPKVCQVRNEKLRVEGGNLAAKVLSLSYPADKRDKREVILLLAL